MMRVSGPDGRRSEPMPSSKPRFLAYTADPLRPGKPSAETKHGCLTARGVRRDPVVDAGPPRRGRGR